MKRSFAVLGVICSVFSISGCSQVDAPEEIPSVNKNLSVLVPEYTEVSKVRLTNGRRFVSLGDTEDKAFSIFPRPSRGFTLQDETIPGLPVDFKSKGWESNSEGFGIILHDDKVVLAMRQYEAIEADEFAGILAALQAINGIDRFQSVTQDKVEYWFIKSGLDVLSISRVPSAKKRYQVTTTIGNEHVMDSLGILKGVKKTDTQPTFEKHAL